MNLRPGRSFKQYLCHLTFLFLKKGEKCFWRRARGTTTALVLQIVDLSRVSRQNDNFTFYIPSLSFKFLQKKCNKTPLSFYTQSKRDTFSFFFMASLFLASPSNTLLAQNVEHYSQSKQIFQDQTRITTALIWH